MTERRNRIGKTREPGRIEYDRINHGTSKQHLILISAPGIFGNERGKELDAVTN